MDPKFVISHNGPIMGKNYFFTCLLFEVRKTHPPNLYNFKIQSSLAGPVEAGVQGVQGVQLHTQYFPLFKVKIQVLNPKSWIFISICTPNV